MCITLYKSVWISSEGEQHAPHHQHPANARGGALPAPPADAEDASRRPTRGFARGCARFVPSGVRLRRDYVRLDFELFG